MFFQDNETSEDITDFFMLKRMDVVRTSSRLEMEERRRRLDFLKDKTLIVSTNLLAIGLDVESLRVVVNFDLPCDRRTDKVDKKTYTYRNGRCARFGKKIVLTQANS